MMFTKLLTEPWYFPEFLFLTLVSDTAFYLTLVSNTAGWVPGLFPLPLSYNVTSFLHRFHHEISS